MRLRPSGPAWFVAFLLGLLATPAASSSSIDGDDASIALPPGSTVRAPGADDIVALRLGSAWRGFTARHGAWSASWNASTGTPHRAAGPPIPLPGYADDAASVDRSVRRFITREADLFGRRDLQTLEVRRHEDLWVIRYRQAIRGVHVVFEDWEFRVHESGRLIAFGFDGHPDRPEVTTRPVLPWAVAREAARSGVRFDPTRDRTTGGELVLVPHAGAPGGLRLAYGALVESDRPRARWSTLVDAASGEVLWRQNLHRNIIGGAVSGLIHPVLPSDPLESRPFPHLKVSVGVDSVFTDAAGSYSAPATGTVTVSAGLVGRFAAVDNLGGAGADATFTQMATDPATVDIVWDGSNSTDAERDAYFHVNRAHDFVKSLEPAWTGVDYRLPCTVDYPGSACGAGGGATGLDFGEAGDGCPSMATLPDVVYHEYGHAVDETMYTEAGLLNNLNSIGEGLADILAFFVQDDPIIGQGFFGPGTYIRNHENENRWPEDRGTDAHVPGQILGGAYWDLRESLGLATASHLWHSAKRNSAGDPNDLGVAMYDFFFESLVVDDDDGDLTNGTPNFAAINAAFDAHGIGTGFHLSVAHTEVSDQAAVGSFPVTATLSGNDPLAVVQGATLFVSINGAPYVGQTMTSGRRGKFSSVITPTSPSLIRYYVRGEDDKGGTQTSPPGAPLANVHVFRAGPVATAIFHDMETDQGWTAGDPSDDATAGLWIRDVPVGAKDQLNNPTQPSADHSPNGARSCFVTGNAAPKDFFTTQMVKGGKTTLYSPLFSAVGMGDQPAIEYWRWYTNVATIDRWQVDISNDGGATWVPVERSNHRQSYWRRVAFLVSEYVTPSANMRMRFVAEERIRRNGIIEAAVDDFRLFAVPATGAAGPSRLAASGGTDLRFSLRTISRNPFHGAVSMAYVLPAEGKVSFRIYDIAGRVIRDLDDGLRSAGEHTLRWDGRDHLGRTVADGVYFARIEAAGQTAVTRVVRMQ